MIGIQVCMLQGNSFEEAIDFFGRLRSRVLMQACEIHLERSLYPAAFWPWNDSARNRAGRLRATVKKLGVHLPFVDLNPISSNARIAEASCSILESSIECASTMAVTFGNRIRKSEFRMPRKCLQALVGKGYLC